MRIRLIAVVSIAALALTFVGGTSVAKRRPWGGTGTTACGTTLTGKVTWKPAKLWPPNHKMRDITISYDSTSDDGDTLTLTVDSISSDEDGIEGPKTAKHDPDYPDLVATPISDTGTDVAPPAPADPATVIVPLRSERMGKHKEGRTYTINVTCTDTGLTPDAGTAVVTVNVPHDRRR